MEPEVWPVFGEYKKGLAALPFDPWTHTIAMAQIARALDDQAVGCGKVSAAHQQRNAREILNKRDDIVRGDGKATLFATVQCLEAGLVAPDWLAAALLRCYDTVVQAHAGSWDDVFGVPWRGTVLSDKRRELEIARPIVHAVEKLASTGRSRTAPLFAEVAEQLSLSTATSSGASYCSKLYYRWRDEPEFALVRAASAVLRDDRKHTRAAKTSTRKKKDE